METLFTPWRYDYISANRTPEGCFFCAAAGRPEEDERLVVHLAGHHLVLLNRHPYTNGHVMIAPLEHLARPEDAAPEARAEFWPLVIHTRQVLQQVYSPDGFNLGMNLGRAAGAGVPEHFHLHVVPRWAGDTSFMGSVGGVRLVPEDLDSVRAKLRRAFAAEGG